MPSRLGRGLAIRDVLILVAAAALGLAWMRDFQGSEEGGESYPDFEGGWSSHRAPAVEWAFVVAWWHTSLSRCLAVIAPTLVVLQLAEAPRRRRWTIITRRPGAVAGLAMVPVLVADLSFAVGEIVLGVLGGKPRDSIWQFTYLTFHEDSAAVAVGASWTLLALSGRWRWVPDWLDLLGVAIACFWFCGAMLSWALNLADRAGLWF